ncbi:hypothetical protein LIER_38635 [Lithospermum erythrorhizon]|uniref:Uncharacterized protein n=1 Tax=Lithospermum erythrorhizon TaxID=34254 RepID=A0AAV3Q2W7_LITER
MEDDAQFFRDEDMLDVELDAEISVETMALKKRGWLKQKKLQGRMPKKKKHGVEFKLKKEARYEESSNDEKDDILSDCDSDESLKSLADSSDEEPLWLATNDNTRFSIKYKFSCTFSVWIAKDCKLSPTDRVVKSVVRAHSGCLDERIVLCNSRFLSKAMEGKFRVIPEMDLAADQVFVE